MIINCPPGQYTQIAAASDKAYFEFRGSVSIIVATLQPAVNADPDVNFGHGERLAAQPLDKVWCKPQGIDTVPVSVSLGLNVIAFC